MKQQYATLELRTLKQMEVPDAQGLSETFASMGMFDGAQETFWVVAYDSMRNMRSIVEVARGSFNDVMVHIPSIMAAVFAAGTDRFSVVHSHPNGSLEPSDQDIRLTQKIGDVAAQCGLFFEDHIIVAPPDKAYSMVAMGDMVIDPTVRAERESRIRSPKRKAITMVVTCGEHL